MVLTRAPALWVAVLGVLAASLGACPAARRARFVSDERAGVRLEVIAPSRVPAGPRAQARAGDFLLSAGALRVAVGRAGPEQPRSLAGALLDATAREWVDDRLAGVRLVIEVEGNEVESIVRVVSPDLSGAAPRLSIESESRDRSLQAITWVSLDPSGGFIELETELRNRAERPKRARLGDRLLFYGDEPFAPGLGLVTDEREAVTPWFAQPGRRQSYALAFPAVASSVRFRRAGPAAHEQTALGPEQVVAPKGRVTHRRRLLVARGPLPAVAERALRASGTEPGFITGQLAVAPGWGVIEARDASGRLMQLAELSGASYRLPVAPGTYEVRLRAPGGTDRARATVRAGQATPTELIAPRAARLDYRIADSNDAPMPGRIVVRGVPPTANPDLGPLHLASGAANVACTASGAGSVELPPGRYSVLATRGPEWDVAEELFEVSETSGATFRARLSRVVDTSGWVAADLHVHADPSGDSEVPLPDRVASLLAEGIELAVATDHNHVTDYAPAVRALHASERISTQPGIEVTTRDWGHFNTYPYPLGAPLPPASELAPRELLPWLRSAAPGALIQVNHPRMGDIGYFNQMALDAHGSSSKAGATLDFDLIEVWNGFDLAELARLDEGLAEWMRLLALGRRYTAVGSSDSHRIAFQWAGYPRTWVRAEDARPGAIEWSSVAAALRAGRAQVSSGPFIELRVGGEQPGALVRAEQGKVGIELEVRAPPWMSVERAEIFSGGQRVLHVEPRQPEHALGAGPKARLRFTGTVPVERDTFVLVVARGSSTLDKVLPGVNVVPVAFTNPVFVDADGDGRFSPVAQPSSRDKNE